MSELIQEQVNPSRTDVWKMFDRIAHRYDTLNRCLSFGNDMRWRRRMCQYLPERSNLSVLDIATGTADQLLILTADRRVDAGLGVDLAQKMLDLGQLKVQRAGLNKRVVLRYGDAERLPVSDNHVDVVTMSFGIRNVNSVSTALTEMHRVLKTKGRALVLEFSLPANRCLSRPYLCYFRYLLPRVGSALSGDVHAYGYLNRTVETFPHGEDFCHLMEAAGFANVRAHPLTFGIASIYQGDKL